MPASEPIDNADAGRLRDAAYVFATQAAIRRAVNELSFNPLDPECGARVRSLLGEPSVTARSALRRMEAQQTVNVPAQALRLVSVIGEGQAGT